MESLGISVRRLEALGFSGQLSAFIFQKKIDKLENLFLSDYFAIDHITTDYWESWPWKELETEPLEVLIDMVVHGIVKDYWSDSCKRHVQLCHAYRIGLEISSNLPLDTQKHLLIGMNDKKKHEVMRMAPLISSIAEKVKCVNILDVGCGQGYLSTTLALHYNLKVWGIDRSMAQINGAQSRADHLIRIHNKHNLDMGSLCFLNFEFSCLEDLVDQLPDIDKWIVVGLHCCGDLSPSMLRSYKTNPKISAIVNVGCCYQLLSSNGFPMVSKNLSLTPNCLMTACQATARWDNVADLNNSFQRLFYRAVLEKIRMDFKLYRKSSSPTEAFFTENGEVGIKRLPSKALESPAAYCRAALEKLGISYDLPIETIDAYFLWYESCHAQIRCIWAMRSLLADSLEKAILNDRMLYISDQEESFITPIFDKKISPRNAAIVSIKRL